MEIEYLPVRITKEQAEWEQMCQACGLAYTGAAKRYWPEIAHRAYAVATKFNKSFAETLAEICLYGGVVRK